MSATTVISTSEAVSTAEATENATALTTTVAQHANPSSSTFVCRYFLRGMCRFGPQCRFSHDTSALENNDPSVNCGEIGLDVQPKPSTSRNSNWANAPIFVPTRKFIETNDNIIVDNIACDGEVMHKSWASVVSGVDANTVESAIPTGYMNITGPACIDTICPYESPCPYGEYCAYKTHLELCEMCDQFCLHPDDEAQRRKHKKECLQQHEQAMELSFAIARSKDKTCGICFDTIMEKAGREKRFGILPNCSHIFCLECIRKWRQAKQFEHKITRSCPECRVSSDFVCPSAFWVETKEEKDKLLTDYRSALGIKDCKYFKKGDGKCPFGNKCFYKHAMPNGELVDVGCPKRARKLHRSPNEIIDLLDTYLWEFVDHRDYHWVDLLSSGTESDSDEDGEISDWSETGDE